MGCETWVLKCVNVCNTTFNSKQELQNAIKDCESDISYVKEKIRTYVFMTEPGKFIPNDEIYDTIGYLDRELTELWDMYDEARIKLTQLWELEEAWDKSHDKNGFAILPINPLELDKTYFGGDYVNCVLEDGSEVPNDYWDVYNGFVDLENYSFKDKLKTLHIFNKEKNKFE